MKQCKHKFNVWALKYDRKQVKAPKETNQRNSLEVRVIKEERVSSPGPLKTGALLVAPSLQYSSLLTWQAPISEKKANNKHSRYHFRKQFETWNGPGCGPQRELQYPYHWGPCGRRHPSSDQNLKRHYTTSRWIRAKTISNFPIADKMTRSKQTLSSIRQTAFWRRLGLVLKSSRAAEN